MYQNELVFRNHESGFDVAKALFDEHYVVLLSYEENFLIVNWKYSPESNKNDVVFMGREKFEEEYV